MKHYDNIDLLKFIAIIMVITQHVPLFECDFIKSGNIGNAIQLFFRLLFSGVPIFVTVNGFLMLQKESFDLKKHIIKTIKMFILTCVWAFILIIINLLFDKTPINRTLVIDLFVKTRSGSLYTAELWFMQYLVGINIIYPLIWNIYKNDKKTYYYLFLVIVLFTLGINVIEIIQNIITKQANRNTIQLFIDYLEEFNLLNTDHWFILYFMLGGVIYDQYDYLIKHKRTIVILGICSWVATFIYGYFLSVRNNVFFGEHYSSTIIFNIVIILAWFMLADSYKDKNIITKCIKIVGTNTFGIYVMHSFIIRVVRLIFTSGMFADRCFITVFTLIICTLLTKILRKIPFVSILFNI